MDDVASKFNRVFSELQFSKTCNSLLRKRIVDLEGSSLDNAQYLRREMTDLPGSGKKKMLPSCSKVGN